MPTYEYACKSCGKRFDVVQKFSDDALTKCILCEDGEVKKVFSAVGISFKGSGFYKNDSRGGSSSAKSSSSSSSDSGSSSDTPTKSETKSESSTPAPAAPSTPAPSTSSTT